MEDSVTASTIASLAIPADTATFTYDAAGNLRSAVNRDAAVSRLAP